MYFIQENMYFKYWFYLGKYVLSVLVLPRKVCILIAGSIQVNMYFNYRFITESGILVLILKVCWYKYWHCPRKLVNVLVLHRKVCAHKYWFNKGRVCQPVCYQCIGYHLRGPIKASCGLHNNNMLRTFWPFRFLLNIKMY